jgi:hypothetical protein
MLTTRALPYFRKFVCCSDQVCESRLSLLSQLGGIGLVAIDVDAQR